MFFEDYERIMQEVTDKLDPKVKEFADWQVDTLFPELMEKYNEVYILKLRFNETKSRNKDIRLKF